MANRNAAESRAEYDALNWADLLDSLSGTVLKEGEPGSEESRAMWDSKAAAFTHKPSRSGYIAQLLDLLALEEGESLFDMGCGPGIAAIPLALEGHDVVAVDFSSAMLDELQAAAQKAGIRVVRDGAPESADAACKPADAASPLGDHASSHPGKTAAHANQAEPAHAAEPNSTATIAKTGAHAKQTPGTIYAYQRSWQEPWDDLPQADVALSSRSLISKQRAQAVQKLQGQARKRVVITTGAGDLPYRDSRIHAAMGRSGAAMQPNELIFLSNYLFSQGFLPRIEYLRYDGRWHRPTRKQLVEAIRSSHDPQTPEEERLLDEFLKEHIIFNLKKGRYELDYPRKDSWAYVEWQLG